MAAVSCHRCAARPVSTATATTKMTASTTLPSSPSSSPNSLAPITPPASPPTMNSAARKTTRARTQPTTAAAAATMAATATDAPSPSATSQPSAKPHASSARWIERSPTKQSSRPTTASPTPVTPRPLPNAAPGGTRAPTRPARPAGSRWSAWTSPPVRRRSGGDSPDSPGHPASPRMDELVQPTRRMPGAPSGARPSPATTRLVPSKSLDPARRREQPGSRCSGVGDAAESEVAGGAVDRLALASGGAVAHAVRRRAQVRAALDHPPGVLVELFWGRRAAARVIRRGVSRVVRGGRPGGGGPLPDLAGDVVQAEAVGREPLDRRGALEAVRVQVLPREAAVPAVGHDPATRRRVLAPGVGGLVPPAAGGVLPLRLGGQPAAGPAGVGDRVGMGHVHDRVQVPAVQGGARALRVPPVGPGHPVPPGGPVLQRHRPRGGDEHQRAGQQQTGIGTGEGGRVGGLFGDGDVPGVLDEPAERGIGDRVLVDPQVPHDCRPDRRLLRVEPVAAHPESPAGYEGRAAPVRADPARARGGHSRAIIAAASRSRSM